MMSAHAESQHLIEDTELARRIAQHDEHAFEVVMRRHNRLLYRLARSILNDDAEAEDAVQECYLAAFRNIDGFRGAARVSTWLARIVINEAYARLRKRSRRAVIMTIEGIRREGETFESPQEHEYAASAAADQPETAAMRAELRGLLERHITALPEQFRTVFVLRDVEEMSVEETAACLDIPAATVRTRAFRARALLRSALSRDLDAATVDAFGFAGDRCDRIVARVLEQIRRFNSPEESS